MRALSKAPNFEFGLLQTMKRSCVMSAADHLLARITLADDENCFLRKSLIYRRFSVEFMCCIRSYKQVSDAMRTFWHKALRNMLCRLRGAWMISKVYVNSLVRASAFQIAKAKQL
jgi:hypothetical protein